MMKPSASSMDQLFSQRDRGAETRGFRRGILIGSAVGTSLMAVMAATIGVYIVHPTAEQVDGAAASIEQGSGASEETSVLRPADATTTMVAPTGAAEDNETTSITATAPTLLSTPSPPMEGEDPPPLAVPPVARPPAGPRLSAGEIDALLARGDA